MKIWSSQKKILGFTEIMNFGCVKRLTEKSTKLVRKKKLQIQTYLTNLVVIFLSCKNLM